MAKSKPSGVLPIPHFVDLVANNKWGYSPPLYDVATNRQPLAENAREWARIHSITPSHQDTEDNHLLIIDNQQDFCYPQGTLYVAGNTATPGVNTGALDDNVRTARFILENLPNITQTSFTFDTHHPLQIFFPDFWRKQPSGEPLAPHRTISIDEIRRREILPDPDIASWLVTDDVPLPQKQQWLEKQVRYYVDVLAGKIDEGLTVAGAGVRSGKYDLYLWPPHCILGTPGHALVGIVQEARLLHAYARHQQPWAEIKGGNAFTENYSVFAPEVMGRWDGGSIAQMNTELLGKLQRARRVLIAGQAFSHCVAWSALHLMHLFGNDRAVLKKVFFIEDLMSAVNVPGVHDFTPEAQAVLHQLQDAGVHVVRSTTPMTEWDGWND